MPTPSENIANHLEVLVYTSVRKDAEMTASILVNAGFKARVVTEFSNLSDELVRAGAIVLSEEALSRPNLELLKQKISEQPRWSDLPVIMVTSGANSSIESHERLEWMAVHLQNVTLLERPIRLATLITIVRTALSSRQKQFELKTLLEELEESKRIAEDANEAKSMFLANMSHEIRTPLAAIVGFTSLMRDQRLPAEERLQFADVIARNGDQLSSLINDILDLSKVEAGKLDVEYVDVSLPTLFAELTSWLRPTVEAKGLDFIVEIKSKLPEIVKADSTRIRQVLLNLVSNAVKFTQQGAITLTVEVERTSPALAQIRFKVVDSGIGMSEKDKKRLFKPFSQADPSMTRRFGGTGLGLVLSKGLAHAMGGDLTLLDSGIGKGSRFEFRLPLEVVTAKTEKEQKKAISTDSLKGMRVLLVEDSPDNQFLMNRYLRGAGAEVTTADNGQSAIDHALASHYDVILMDIQMPLVDGLTATRELRSRNYEGPIIALTAHALREERDRSISAGCNDHLTKPIDREVLVQTLSTYPKAQ
jgi:signal transduction histidine kinase/BarA-like signal transduction histidine kinase